MSYRAAVALGSNLGDRLDLLRRGVEALGRIGSVTEVSALYETAPVGGPEQEPYLNAVAVIITDLAPDDLLARTQEIENQAGRVRAERWGPRTLDLDIVAMVDHTGAPVVVDSERLQLPHPQASQRRFVLEPLVEVWPDAPVGTATARAALQGVADQEVERLSDGWTGTNRSLSVALVVAQGLLLGAFTVAAVTTGRLPRRSWPAAVGGAAAVAGGLVAGWAALSLGAALTPFPEPKTGTRLVDSGPYGQVRHPIYAGIELAVLGVAILVRSWTALGVGAILGVLFWFKAGYEEGRLRLSVSGYPAYMRRVRGRLVPSRR